MYNEKTSIVMLAYNEANRIEALVKEYYNEIYIKLSMGSEFIIYIDGSKDETPQILQELSKTMSLKIIDNKENKGYYEAAKAALSYANCPYVFFSDSSGKHKAQDYWLLTPFAEKYDVVSGFRKNRSDSLYRKIISLILRNFVSIIFLLPKHDYNCGYKIYKKHVLDTLLEKCNTMNIVFSTEFMIRAIKEKISIISVPVSFVHNGRKEGPFSIKKLPGVVIKELLSFIRLRIQLITK